MASSQTKLEQRVTALEAEVSQLKHLMAQVNAAPPWWEQIMGTFEENPIYDEAMQRGRQYRESLRPKTATRGQK